MRCFFCGGNLDMGFCIMCGRSADIKHELCVKKEQKKKHHNWHGNNPPMWKRVSFIKNCFGRKE